MRSIYFRLSVETLKKLKEEGKDLENLKRITDSRKIFKALFRKLTLEMPELSEFSSRKQTLKMWRFSSAVSQK